MVSRIMKQRYARFMGRNIYLQDRVTYALKLKKRGLIAIQDLKTGDTAQVKRKLITDISYKHPDFKAPKIKYLKMPKR